MEEQKQNGAHPLQGPHRDPRPELPAGFAPIRLVLAALGLRIEVHLPEVIIGRHSRAEVRLALPEISRRHCRLFFKDRFWHVRDLTSLNGVFINGVRIEEAGLYPGDLLQLGKFVFQIEDVARTEAPECGVLKSIADVMTDQKWAS